jgi:hypothetical protein
MFPRVDDPQPSSSLLPVERAPHVFTPEEARLYLCPACGRRFIPPPLPPSPPIAPGDGDDFPFTETTSESSTTGRSESVCGNAAESVTCGETITEGWCVTHATAEGGAR